MGLEAKLTQDGFLATKLDAILAWSRKSSVWPMPMGISCCAIEMMAAADPKWVIAMGACTSTGGMYRSYPVVQGIDQFLPVDIYVAGCPPRPDNLLNALIQLQEKIGRTKARDFQNKPLPELNIIQNN